MKNFGSFLSFTDERNIALIQTYRKLISETSHIRLADIAIRLANSPSPRFWVSEDRATTVISSMLRGMPVLDIMRPTKREMFSEIFNRVSALRSLKPAAPLCELVAQVIYSPAPKFYLEPSSAIKCIFKIRNGWYDKRHKKYNPGK